MSDFAEGIELTLKRRSRAVAQIYAALGHLDRPQLIGVLASYIPLDELEAALPTICGGNPTEDAAIAADFAAFGKKR